MFCLMFCWPMLVPTRWSFAIAWATWSPRLRGGPWRHLPSAEFKLLFESCGVYCLLHAALHALNFSRKLSILDIDCRQALDNNAFNPLTHTHIMRAWVINLALANHFSLRRVPDPFPLQRPPDEQECRCLWRSANSISSGRQQSWARHQRANVCWDRNVVKLMLLVLEVSNMLHYKRMKMCHRECAGDIMISWFR